jgi:hypothetical protein
VFVTHEVAGAGNPRARSCDDRVRNGPFTALDVVFLGHIFLFASGRWWRAAVSERTPPP